MQTCACPQDLHLEQHMKKVIGRSILDNRGCQLSFKLIFLLLQDFLMQSDWLIHKKAS